MAVEKVLYDSDMRENPVETQMHANNTANILEYGQ